MNLQFLDKTSRYGLAATTALAALPPGARVSSIDLAEQTGVPPAFLGKVLGQLARAGIVDGVKGHGGGYQLARDAGAITLFEVVEALHEEGGLPTPCALGAVACDPSHPCAIHDRWSAIQASFLTLLRSVSVAEAAAFEDLAAQVSRAR